MSYKKFIKIDGVRWSISEIKYYHQKEVGFGSSTPGIDVYFKDGGRAVIRGKTLKEVDDLFVIDDMDSEESDD